MYLLLAGVVLAALSVGGEAQRPDPCCLPEQWTGVVHQNLRYSRKDAPSYGYRSAYMEYAYDYPSRRLAARIHNEYPNAYLRFVLNFQQDRAYFIDDGGCRYRSFRAREFGRQCISESASYQGTFFMGLDKVTFYRWFVFNDHVDAVVDVTSENCVPGFDRERFENDLYVNHIDRIYANITSNIRDESIFEEPTDCVQETETHFLTDTSDAGLLRMHAFHSIPTLLSSPSKKQPEKPTGF